MPGQRKPSSPPICTTRRHWEARVTAQITLGEIVVDVVQKDIKNLHLTVHPPDGHVRISAPLRMGLDTIRVYAITKLGWIKAQQKKMRDQEREPPREFIDRESHYLWGNRYLMQVVEKEAAPGVALSHQTLYLQVRPGATEETRQSVLEAFYRAQIKAAAPPIIARWEPHLHVKVARFFVQRMKTRWGSCTHDTRTIRLNTELAKKPPECLEYIVIHELVHLLEPTHNKRFVALMDAVMPPWRHHRDALNRLPVRHEAWGY